MPPNLVQRSAHAKNISAGRHARNVLSIAKSFGPRATKQAPVLVQHGERLATADIYVARRHLPMITVTNIVG